MVDEDGLVKLTSGNDAGRCQRNSPRFWANMGRKLEYILVLDVTCAAQRKSALHPAITNLMKLWKSQLGESIPSQDMMKLGLSQRLRQLSTTDRASESAEIGRKLRSGGKMGRKLPSRLKICSAELVSDGKTGELTGRGGVCRWKSGRLAVVGRRAQERPAKVGWVCWRESPAGGMAALPLGRFRLSLVLHPTLPMPSPSTNSASLSRTAILLPSVVQHHRSGESASMQRTG